MQNNRPTDRYGYEKSHAKNTGIYYDARGVRVKNTSPLSNKLVRTLLFWVLPYVVINGLIFMLVCSSPKIEITVGDTDDYVTAGIDFTVKSILPVKNLEVSLESSPVEYEKSGSRYSCSVTHNGTFTVRATSLNGMQKTVFADVSVLDDTAPSIDEESASVSRGILTFTVNDTQSGVDFSSIYGIVDDDTEIRPFETDSALGIVSMELPSSSDTIELHFSDMVGNERTGRITITVGGVETDNIEEETDAAGTEASS